jgi:hypothetical protein
MELLGEDMMTPSSRAGNGLSSIIPVLFGQSDVQLMF